MLITHTEREIVLVLPRFRVVAVSMQRLQIGRARITSIATDVVDLDPIIMLEEQPTIATAPALPLQQFCSSKTHTRVSSMSRAPVHPIAIIGTAVALDLDMPGDGHLAVRQEVCGIGIGGGGGKGQTGAQPVPVPLHPPGGGLLRVSPVCPAAELCPGEVVEPFIDGLAHAGAVIVRPTPDFGVELADQLTLRKGLPALNDPPNLRQMLFDIGLGGCDQGFVPQPPTAPRAFARLVFAHLILPDVQPQERKPWLIAIQSVTDATFGLVQRQSDLCQPRHEQLSAVLQDGMVFVQHHTIIRISDDTGSRVYLGDGLVPPVQGN